MKATDSALNAYETTKSLDTFWTAERGLYGLTTANGLGEYVTGKGMFGNELSEEQRGRSLNEALAFLGGNAISIGGREANPTVNLGQVNKGRKSTDNPISKNIRMKVPNNEVFSPSNRGMHR